LSHFPAAIILMLWQQDILLLVLAHEEHPISRLHIMMIWLPHCSEWPPEVEDNSNRTVPSSSLTPCSSPTISWPLPRQQQTNLCATLLESNKSDVLVSWRKEQLVVLDR
jgi:hypothetical protein